MVGAVDQLNRVFSEGFIQKNKDVDNIDDLFDAVIAVDPCISRSDYDEYVKTISDSMHADELNEGDLESVTGGIAWATVGAVCALITFSYKAGEAIGSGIYYLRHRK